MAKSNIPEIIEKPYNVTDAEVKLDPDYNKKVIIKEYDDPTRKASTQEFDNLKDDAINIPVIRLNNIVLMDEQIDQLVLYCDEFLPKLHLSIKDKQNVIKICDTPGFDNEINIVITAQIDGYYKKISLLFYITKFYEEGDYIGYDAIFKLQSMNSHIIKQIGKGKLNTYNMLNEIAKENKLGFAATKKCEEIKDERYRLMNTQTFTDFIQEQIAISGIDENSIFDAWVDIFGYIVMINVHYVMTEKINPQQLTIYTIVNGENNLNNGIDGTGVLVQRTLTNNKINVASTNLHFDNYEYIIDNKNIYEEGSLNTNYYMISPCEDNTIQTEQIQLLENSVDGIVNSNKYEFGKSQFIGIEFDDLPILMKEKINKRYLDKLRAKKLKIELTKHNLGLERGMLVNVLFKEYDLSIIKKIDPALATDEESAAGVVNPYTSGMYYIDSIKFEYVTENHKIQQFLYLIKRDTEEKILNNVIGPRDIEENT